MSTILDKQICLKLNRNWVGLGFVSVRDAVTFLCSEKDGKPPGYAIDCEMSKDENGESVLVYANPVPWNEWIKLPVRDIDLAITTGRGQIRAPLIVVCANFSKTLMRTSRWSTGNVHKRDNYTCAYTGEKLSHATATVDHVVPRDKGGKDTWENTVSCHRRINSMKANRTPEEAGLKLLITPKAPPVMPVVITASDARHEMQKHFLIN